MSNVVPIRTMEPVRPRDYNPAQLALIRRTVAADTTQDEFDMFIEVCRRVGLDPFRKQLYCLVYNKDKPDKRKVAFITGIDGFRAVAQRNGDYRPDDAEPEIAIDPDQANPATNPLGIVKAVVKAYKRGPDGWHAVVGVAHWDEFAPLVEEWAYDEAKGKRQPTGKYELAIGNWRKMPRVMIVKCAEAQALRRGWPEDLSGVYSPEEMDGATMRDITPSAEIEQHEQQRRLALINAKDTIPIQWAAGEPIEAVPMGQFADRVSAFVRGMDSPTGLDKWETTNKAGLNEFWARQKPDALELKKVIEGRKKALAAE